MTNCLEADSTGIHEEKSRCDKDECNGNRLGSDGSSNHLGLVSDPAGRGRGYQTMGHTF